MDKFENAFQKVKTILEERNISYGDDNLLTYGLFGIAVRLNDKLSRLQNLLINYLMEKDAPYENLLWERVEDTLIDIAGYAVNALRLMEEGRITAFGKMEAVLYEMVKNQKRSN